MLVDVFKDIQNFKKDYEGHKGSGNHSTLTSSITANKNNSGEFESGFDSIFNLLQSIEVISNDVINNKNLLKNVLDKDHEEKKRCVEKIKNTINGYINFYDYIDEIRQAIKESTYSNDYNLITEVNSLMRFLEKEYLEIGLTVYTPNVDIDKFDSSKHEIFSTEKNLSLAEGTITQVLKKGFYYNDRNIRFTRTARVVTVSN